MAEPVNNIEKATTLVKELAEIADKLDIEKFELIVYLTWGFLIFLLVKSIFAFYSARNAERVLKENADSMTNLKSAIDVLAETTRKCELNSSTNRR